MDLNLQKGNRKEHDLVSIHTHTHKHSHNVIFYNELKKES